MLIATIITLLFLGSGAGLMLDGVDQIHNNINSQIVDEGTRKAALDIVEMMEDTTKYYADADGDAEQQLLKLMQQYETTTAQLQNNLDATYKQRIQYQQQMLAMRFDLKDKLTREQWDKVFQSKEQ